MKGEDKRLIADETASNAVLATDNMAGLDRDVTTEDPWYVADMAGTGS